ncbi:hypothetical protein Pmani_032696 [Petrolisthes manimaculis]|uniref:Uncharacterized protein n=1 Tax=Petrolisthes manimaculis TaxID=1843537 RepID=A0AAE1TR73_9EUCA|nr:hypothetical protein Pmani_032696 [Petrolisthes manimaculis]
MHLPPFLPPDLFLSKPHHSTHLVPPSPSLYQLHDPIQFHLTPFHTIQFHPNPLHDPIQFHPHPLHDLIQFHPHPLHDLIQFNLDSYLPPSPLGRRKRKELGAFFFC